MKRQTERDLRAELAQVQARLAESEATIKAIRSGEVDAIVVDGPKGSHLFTLQSTEEPYRILAERMNEGAATLTLDGTILFCNRRLAEMLGLPTEQLLGSSLIPFLCEDEQHSFQELVHQALQDNVRCEGQLLCKSGTPLAVQLSFSAIPLEESGQGICLVASDLSDRKRVEESNLRLGAIVNSTDDAIIGKTLDGIVTSWNRGAETIYGYSAQEMIGQSILKLGMLGGSEELKSIMERVQRGDPVRNVESVRLRKDGRQTHVSLTVSPLKDVSGHVVGISTIARDITERRRAEEKLRTASLYTRSLIEASLDPLVTISRKGKITDVNQATEFVTGVARRQLIGSDFSTYFTEPEMARKGYEQVFAQGSVRDYPLAIRHVSGRITEVLYNATLFKDEAGKVEGVFAAARDITERKRFEQTLQEKNVELENASLAKDRFLASMSHELRTPLNAIMGFTGTLLMKLPGPLTDDQDKQLRTIQASSRHLLSLINDLLDLAKIESGKVELNEESVSCQSVVEEVSAALRPLAKGKGLAFEVQVPERDIVIRTDRRSLTQILINLTNNAIKFTEKGAVRLELRERQDNGFTGAEISIVDTGVGIRRQDQTKLFQAFTQVDNSSTRPYEGTGLGLHLSQKLARMIGGHISFASEHGKGSRFTVTLPFAEEAARHAFLS